MQTHRQNISLTDILRIESTNTFSPSFKLPEYDHFLLERYQAPAIGWWREHHALPDASLPSKEAIQSLQDTLHWICSHSEWEASIATTVELQLIARMALRIGAWKLLKAALSFLLYQLRSHIPTPLKMSKATGLLTEWALSANIPSIAFIYGRESLMWGSEPHRIRSYLAYARACLKANTPRDELDILLSLQATEHQIQIANRKAFGDLHEIRIGCLNILQPSPLLPSYRKALKTKIRNFLESASPTHSATFLVSCTLASMKNFNLEQVSPASLQDAQQWLTTSGRWRDRILLNQVNPEIFPTLTTGENDFLEELNALSSHFSPLPDCETVDGPYLNELPINVLCDSTNQAHFAALSCI